MTARYVVGIDLGTTHTVVAACDTQAPQAAIALVPMPQLIAPGEVAAPVLLPSLMYRACVDELPPSALALPWPSPEPRDALVGRIARLLGAQVPGRLVASAKSWLSHGGVDRLAPILPWGGDEAIDRVSPVQASTAYLAHVRAAWNHAHPADRLEHQDVVLTVPASFDDGARELTRLAAHEAGLARVRLLEEPQAALQDWIWRHRDTLAASLGGTRRVLVCDVGGGTTDLSLVEVDAGEAGGGPRLTRVGVGPHLMLGGDNMDLALARIVEPRLAGGAGATPLTAARLAQLVDRCRAAKETLLGEDAPQQATVTLVGAGSRLVGASRSASLARDEVERLVVDGFFPVVPLDAPLRRARSGLVELGLPYAADPAVTRHVASFLRLQAGDAAEPGGALPDAVLFNGGVFRSRAVRRRLAEVIGGWRGAAARELDLDDPDVAVARGAVAHGLAQRGQGPRIGGGSPRTYFLVVDPARRQGVCVLPRGSEPGAPIALAERSFALRTGRPVRFHLVSSAQVQGVPATAGAVVDLERLDTVDLPPLATVVRHADDDRRAEVPVRLEAAYGELGTLSLACVAEDDPSRRWQLEFQLRDAAAEGDGTEGGGDAARLELARAEIDRIFGSRAARPDAREIKQLRTRLERLLGSRERWSTGQLRPLADALLERARGRRRSAEHERVWLNLAGYCLRPGFGDPLDAWRLEQLWPLFEAGVAHAQDAQVCAEWWTLWRRVAGGLGDAAQRRLLDDFAQNLEAVEQGRARPPAGVVRAGFDDMVRLGAALERIEAAHKVEIGDWLVGKLGEAARTPGLAAQVLWALGRIGARQPFHGSAHAVVPPEVASRWLQALEPMDWKRQDGAAFAAAHLARCTGDRQRDLAPDAREAVARRLEAAQAAPTWIAMVREVVTLDDAASRQVYGEDLPPGLRLIA